MTDDQERALIAAAEAGLDDAVREAYDDLVRLIQAGVAPRDAVQQVMAGFQGEMAGTLSAALSAVLGQAVGAEVALQLEVGAVQLSRRLYTEAAMVSDAVQSITQRHALGWQDARQLALELYEGYGFRPPGQEPLQISPKEPRLPKYLREALLPDDDVRAALTKAYARLQADNLATEALRAAYTEALAAIDAAQEGVGSALLEKRLEIAFYERMRYWSQRIARTELHRAYAEREALLLLDDAAVQFVQIRRAPGRAYACICILMTGRDLYGLGPGVYPKALAPVPPFHPHCLPGDALVTSSGRVTAVSKRWFDGDVVVIATASGKRLSATVNHPVLTRRGWVGAGLLDVGDEVIARCAPVSVGSGVVVDDEHQDMPSRIADVADAFLRSREMTTREVPVSAEHFHGDGEGSDIAVIGADRELWDRVDAAAGQIGADHAFEVADPGAAGLLGEGVPDLALEALGGAADCGVCGGSIRAALLARQSGVPDALLFAGTAFDDAVRSEPQVDDVSADAELARQIQDGATGPVFADKVVVIEREAFSGHVFNLETDQGHYTANGIVTHNCMCVMSPRLDLSGRQPKDRDPDGDAYFLRRLDAPIAARVMGSQAKRDRVLSGATAEAIVNSTRDPLYRIKTAGQV